MAPPHKFSWLYENFGHKSFKKRLHETMERDWLKANLIFKLAKSIN